MADENVIGSASVKVVADLTQYNADLAAAKATAQGFDAQASAAMAGVNKATADLTARQKQLVSQMLAANATQKEAAAFFGKTADSVKLYNAYLAALDATQKAAAASTAGLAAAQTAASGAANKVATAAEAAGSAANVAAKGFANARVASEAAAIASEILQGRFTRLAGSSLVMARYAGLLPLIFSPVGLAIAGVTAATLAGAAAFIYYADTERRLTLSAFGGGRVSGLSREQIAGAAGASTQSSGQSTSGALSYAETLAAAGARSTTTIAALSASVDTLARLTNQKASAALKEFAGAMEDPTKGAMELHRQLGLFDATQLRAIEDAQKSGDAMKAQGIIASVVAHDFADLHAAGVATPTLFEQIGSTAKDAAHGLGEYVGMLARAIALGGPAEVAVANQLDAVKKAKQAALQRRNAQGAVDDRASQDAAQAASQTPVERERQHYQEMKDQERALAAGQAVEGRRKNTEQYKRDTDALNALRDAIGRVTDAHGNYIRVLDREHQIHQLQAQQIEARKGHNAEEVKSLAERIALLKVGDTIETNADARRQAADAGDIAGARAMPGAGRHNVYAESLAQKGLDAKDQIDLANAYLQGADAAAKAEAAVKGLSRAEREHLTAAQRTAMVQAQLNLDASEAAAQVAHKVLTLEAENAAQDAANRAVAAGETGRKEAERHAKTEVELAPLRAAAALGTAAAKNALAAATERLAAAEAKQDSGADDTEAVDMIEKQRHALALATLKASLVGKDRVAAARAEAELSASQTLGVSATNPATALQQQAITGAGNAGAAEETARLTKAQDDLTRSVGAEIDKMRAQTAVLGMGREAAAEYTKYQELLSEAKKAGIAIDDQEIAKLHALAGAYGQASAAAQKAADAQKATLEASKSLADSFESAIEGVVFDHKSLAQSAHDLAIGIDKDMLRAALSGSGPFAGMLGTGGDSSQGGAHGGLLGQLFGVGLGVKGAGSQAGKMFSRGDTPANPLFVAMAGGPGGGGVGGFLGKLFGGGGDGGVGTVAADGSDISAMAGLFHTGTNYVGTPARQVPVSPRLFVGAPRLHSGLAPDEFPAILQRGEEVRARGARQGRSGGDVHIHVQTQDAGSFRRTGPQIQREMARGMRRHGG